MQSLSIRKFVFSFYLKVNSFNGNYNKILKSDWLSAARFEHL